MGGQLQRWTTDAQWAIAHCLAATSKNGPETCHGNFNSPWRMTTPFGGLGNKKKK